MEAGAGKGGWPALCSVGPTRQDTFGPVSCQWSSVGWGIETPAQKHWRFIHLPIGTVWPRQLYSSQITLDRVWCIMIKVHQLVVEDDDKPFAGCY